MRSISRRSWVGESEFLRFEAMEPRTRSELRPSSSRRQTQPDWLSGSKGFATLPMGAGTGERNPLLSGGPRTAWPATEKVGVEDSSAFGVTPREGNSVIGTPVSRTRRTTAARLRALLSRAEPMHLSRHLRAIWLRSRVE